MSFKDDDFYVSPRQVLTSGTRYSVSGLAVFGIIVFGVALIFGLLNLVAWPLHWWYYGQAVNRDARITQQGYSNQTTMVSQVQEKVSEVDSITSQIASPSYASQAGPLKAQRASIAAIACSDFSQLTATFRNSSGEVTWYSANCSGGVLSPSSPLYVNG